MRNNINKNVKIAKRLMRLAKSLVAKDGKVCQGQCPMCGSDDLEYQDANIDGDSLGYEFTCNECGCQGTEWYNLEYVETTRK